MKTIFKLILGLCLIPCSATIAQAQRAMTSGTIEFEKTANMYTLMRKKLPTDKIDVYNQNKPHYDNYMKNEPQYLKLQSTLIFGNNVSLFTPKPPAKPIFDYYNQPLVDQANIIFNDFVKDQSIIKKEYHERTFSVRDTLRKIKWKITDETREIAGYVCRRANGLLLDSVYAVAFYTDKIHVPGGPESFNGLPGMILGIALPHDNITWYATKVTEAPADVKKLVPPKGGEVINNKGLMIELMKRYKDRGEIGRSYMKGYVL
ncbi:MAG: GLPGLI family protein [Bacteroidota bacterium]